MQFFYNPTGGSTASTVVGLFFFFTKSDLQYKSNRHMSIMIISYRVVPDDSLRFYCSCSCLASDLCYIKNFI